MFENLPDILLIGRNMLHRMDSSGAILQYLPNFLQTLAETKETASILEILEKDLKNEGKIKRQELAKSIDWITENIARLKTSPFAKHPLVQHTIERVEQSKDTKENLPPTIHLNSILINFKPCLVVSIYNKTFFAIRLPLRFSTSMANENRSICKASSKSL